MFFSTLTVAALVSLSTFTGATPLRARHDTVAASSVPVDPPAPSDSVVPSISVSPVSEPVPSASDVPPVPSASDVPPVPSASAPPPATPSAPSTPGAPAGGVPSIPQIIATVRARVDPILAQIDTKLGATPIVGKELQPLFESLVQVLNDAVELVRAGALRSVDELLAGDGGVKVDIAVVAQGVAKLVVDIKARADKVIVSGCLDLPLVATVIATLNGVLVSLLSALGVVLAGLLKLVAPLLGTAGGLLNVVKALIPLNIL